ncbi:chemotaxis protein CheA [Parvularcula sp. ZS-1/3]|uniref:Chemotaxis protein CheA n=1 Tax=Parvularcula mediterranea TaxID=2732508 RepID=A0A7Y3W5A6_9PROT|nr:chemotaxis protein CheA [Parvularcula mediterranea]NNU16313.1 chemotaxis protein CheA [Parvularcula mediterranea]
MSDPLAELRETFFLECDELLEKLESDLLALEQGATDEELVNSAFRAVHSIKGGAGAFGMSGITDCAHVFETALDHVRSGELKLDPDLCQLFLRGKDLLWTQVGAEKGGPPADPAEIEAVNSAFEEVNPKEEEFDASEVFKPVAMNLGDLGGGSDDAAPMDPMDILAQFESGGDDEGEADGDELAAGRELIVAFAPKPEFFARGNDAAPFIRELRDLGEAEVMLDASGLPGFDELDPEKPYFEWTVSLDPSVDEGAVEEIFEFVAEDCTLSVGQSVGFAPDVTEPSEPEAMVFIDFEEEAELEAAAAVVEEVPEVVEPEAPAEVEPQPVESVLDLAQAAAVAIEDDAPKAEEKPKEAEAEKPAEEPTPVAAAAAASPAARQVQAPKPVVRVELGRVDRLINLVSELVISQSMLSQAVEELHGSTDNRALTTGLDEFRQLTRELQESVMAIRAEPVRSMFMRMGQIARSAAQVCGKKVRLVTEGEQTEVDKTVIERLAEPLTHMIRNAVDHGIEGIEERIEAEKKPEGTVFLSAEHHSGRVVLTVRDDGKGVNREKVRAKAIEKGIITEDAVLTDAEIDQLLFAPGFSTASEISQVSGRGVGMDVVKREINSLGGRITMASEPGKGTTFTISLPLTLAVLDGMVIKVAEQTAVLPLSVIAESLRPEADEIQKLGENDQCIFVRGKFVPILDVGDALGYREAIDDFAGKVMLLVENDNGQSYAFAVDEIVDQRQVVIKGLQDNYGRIEGVAAATILGDGQIALILDVNDLTHESTAIGAGVPLPDAMKEAAHV